MNGARWIEAREARKTWRSVLSTWWAGKQREPEPEVAPTKAPLVLVACFVDPEQFQQAALAFRAESFRPEDVEIVSAEAKPSCGWRERVRRVLTMFRNRTSDDGANAGMNCAGWVLVRSAQRFGRACHIIEQFGGTLGLPSAFRQ